MEQEKDTALQTEEQVEEQSQQQELTSQVQELTENFFALAQGLPEWDILPPDTLIQRRKTSK
ncbi:hypothetical protein CSB45_13675 [candidate division KSB3 bacterium]|uniref:Uncharacterized protein n=1 Tax=candidate division KSB3 bacterium TaxID=2044937 RepID=A0A2G6E2P5_9BACT|nr:MAG: hypothetical protein CSB45_13675 [candidate division KSB3 bacterium]PIE28609.1 MAG: hypothetical protein CSA57_13325 [candidate division KSB3 bacterium]